MMNRIAKSVVIGVLLTGTTAMAQTAGTVAEPEVLQSDLPETRGGFDLPPIDDAEDGAGPEGVGEAVREPLRVVATGSVAAQQFGNLATTKHASGVVRDLGDVMVLLHGGINQRVDELGQDDESAPGSVSQTMSEDARDALAELEVVNEEEFNLGLATWITGAYPYMIDAWRELEQSERFDDLAQAVLPHLRGQLTVAERLVEAEGDLSEVGPETARIVSAAAGAEAAPATGTGPAGAEGQTGERQHTPQPEAPAPQSGENYQHEQVETDPSVETRAVEGDSVAAGDLDFINSAGLFMALDNPENELDQLAAVSGLAREQVRVVAAEQVVEAADVERLISALSQGEQAQLREAIRGNDALSSAIEGASASVDDVIALDVAGTGAVLYTWKSGKPAD